jgi:hypothetical protein
MPRFCEDLCGYCAASPDARHVADLAIDDSRKLRDVTSLSLVSEALSALETCRVERCVGHAHEDDARRRLEDQLEGMTLDEAFYAEQDAKEGRHAAE